jgi:hypothetical protein
MVHFCKEFEKLAKEHIDSVMLPTARPLARSFFTRATPTPTAILPVGASAFKEAAEAVEVATAHTTGKRTTSQDGKTGTG